jgi:hypothetical protein
VDLKGSSEGGEVKWETDNWFCSGNLVRCLRRDSLDGVLAYRGYTSQGSTRMETSEQNMICLSVSKMYLVFSKITVLCVE